MSLKRYSNIVSSESLISTEYNKFDWYRFFFAGFNQLYRLISNAEKTRIEQPSMLLQIFLGKWSTIGKIFLNITQSVDITQTLTSIWSGFTGEWGINLINYLKK